MRYTIEVARPVYERTEVYGEGLGPDDAIRAAQAAAAQAAVEQDNGEKAAVLRGDAFVAAVRADGKPLEVPYKFTEYAGLYEAAQLAQFERCRNVLGSKVGSTGTFRVRAGCAWRTYEHTIVRLDRDDTEVAVGLALVRARDPASRWMQAPGRAVALVMDLELVRGPEDRDGERMAVPDKYGALGKLKGYDSPLAHGDTLAQHCHAATEALRSLVAVASAGPEAGRTSGSHHGLDDLQQVLEEARRRIGDWRSAS